jgi:hypothetical protein
MNITAPPWMIIDAVRYCLGRKTTQVATTTDWLIKNWDNLDKMTQDIIKRDIETQFKSDDMIRKIKTTNLPLGQDCDRERWENVRCIWDTIC